MLIADRPGLGTQINITILIDICANGLMARLLNDPVLFPMVAGGTCLRAGGILPDIASWFL